jgi:hypothetical protein
MLTINLFDGNFRFSSSGFSTDYQTTDAIAWTRDQMQWDGITVFTDMYMLDKVVSEVQSPLKIGWLHEPNCLWPDLYHRLTDPDIYNQFDFILTYYQPLLDHSSGKFRLCPYAGVWIPQAEWGLRPKTRNISMLYGAKKSTRGHQIRHEIADALGDRYDIDYYGFKGTPVNYGWETKLKVLRDYKYSIVCETCYESNLFTEILLDCFAVGTIPLFWGCPNIGEYFDSLGVLSFENVYQLEALIKELDDLTYPYLLQAARENLRRVAEYRITESWIMEHGVFDEVMA